VLARKRSFLSERFKIALAERAGGASNKAILLLTNVSKDMLEEIIGEVGDRRHGAVCSHCRPHSHSFVCVVFCVVQETID
jgi:hypothetical protein